MGINFQYAIKIVCGKSDGKALAPGEYWTSINVHNPSPSSVKFSRKIAVALPKEPAAKPTEFKAAELGPDEALEIDRDDVFEHAKVRTFIKGFVIIESQVELDVVAVYTAAGGDGRVETIDIERVVPRPPSSVLPDLIPILPFKNENGPCTPPEQVGGKYTLVVRVKNQGNGYAGPSVTKVNFIGWPPEQMMITSPLPAGASEDLKFTLPFGCFDPNCEFEVTVDCMNQVKESNEQNNTLRGMCRG